VALQIDNICSQPTNKAILHALENLPKDLPETFNRILQKSRNTKENAALTAHSVLLFRIVAAARRPLTVAELHEAVSIEPGETAWDPDQLVNDMQKIISCCGGLVVVDEEDFTVQFLHQSVRQFLCSHLVDERVKAYEMDLASADLDLGIICVTYLNSESHTSQLIKQKPQLAISSAILREAVPSSNLAGKLAMRLLSSKKDITHSMRPSLEAVGALSSSFSSHDQLCNLFLRYAQENWVYHTTQLRRTIHPRIWHLWKRLVTGEVKTARLPWSLEEYLKLSPSFVDFVLKTKQGNLLLVCLGRANASALGDLTPMYNILKEQTKVQEHTLAESEETRQLIQLFKICIGPERVNPSHLDDCSALQVAIYMGFVECVPWLLENGLSVNFQNGYNGTALQVACRRNHEAIVKRLLEKGAEVNLQGGYYGTALQAAFTEGDEAIVKLLLENGADVNLQGGHHDSALIAACIEGNEANVKLLHEYGAAVNLEGGKYGTALQAACLEGNYEAVVKLLLENGAEVNLEGGEYGTALQAACLEGYEAIVKLLLENGADVNLQGGRYGSALQAACRWGYIRQL
jgi:ankyrin repeat protein